LAFLIRRLSYVFRHDDTTLLDHILLAFGAGESAPFVLASLADSIGHDRLVIVDPNRVHLMELPSLKTPYMPILVDASLLLQGPQSS
jgi:hypothetical protein